MLLASYNNGLTVFATRAHRAFGRKPVELREMLHRLARWFQSRSGPELKLYVPFQP
jgi:hypothetical protein